MGAIIDKKKKNFDGFQKKYAAWLENDFEFTIDPEPVADEDVCTDNPDTDTNTRGRPSKRYEDASEGYKRDLAVQLSRTSSTERSIEISRKKMKSSGNLAGAELLMEISEPERAAEIKASIEKKPAIQRSVAKSVSLLIGLNLTREQYSKIRSESRKDGHDWLVSYHRVLEGKKETYPEYIRVTETSTEVGLQSLVYLTTKRLLQYLVENGIISQEEAENILQFILLFKWGFDGTNVNEYNQRSTDPDYDFSHVLCTYMVPLRLIDRTTGRIIWQNPTPNSTRMCRPIRFQYIKETDENFRKEADEIQHQIDELEPLDLGFCRISFKFILSMIDGKVYNALNHSNSQKCFVCKATIGQFNDIDFILRKETNEDNTRCGFTILHAWIRFMELPLNISERLVLPEPMWRALKYMTKARGKEIQKNLKSRIKIVVNKPKHGFGNTNSGNTARIFFDHIDVVAEVTGFNENLLRRLKTTLVVITCGLDVNTEAFRDYNWETARELVRRYFWYRIPSTVHMILMHGHILIKKIHPAIGLCSEEPVESSHKVHKSFREHRSRKSSRVEMHTDVLHRLLLHSDPYITLSGDEKNRKKRELTDEMKSLLILQPNGTSEDPNYYDKFVAEMDAPGVNLLDGHDIDDEDDDVDPGETSGNSEDDESENEDGLSVDSDEISSPTSSDDE